MNKQEIIEGIKLIAKFAGYKLENKEFQYIHYNSSNESMWEWSEGKIVTLNNHEVFDFNNEPYFNLEDLPFNSSWDWLMPVVAKCTDLWDDFGFDSKERYNIEDEIWNLDNTLSDFLAADIDAIFRRTVEFIKWYNKQEKELCCGNEYIDGTDGRCMNCGSTGNL
jgi:hypothetical protein